MQVVIVRNKWDVWTEELLPWKLPGVVSQR